MAETKNNNEAIVSDADSSRSTEASASFLDTIYEKITDVIGGDSADQYFCLNLPGTILNPEDYQYDPKEMKPEHVKANESKLVNKLFDAAFVVNADNGRHLSSQYKTALSMLSPKLNRELFEMKIQLRKVLMTPYPYDFGKGIVEDMTLEQVFYRLYNDYVKAKEEWSQKQADKKADLKKQIIDPVARQDAYLQWYGLVAEAESVALEEKLGKVLNVFSPGDMNIINAILQCGVGGELETARSTLEMVEELSPDGGHVYPVSLYPSNWSQLLTPSFTGVDLLESPAALSQRMKLLQIQRSNLLLNINRLTALIPEAREVAEARATYQAAEESMQGLVQKCVDANCKASGELVKSVLALCTKDSDGKLVPPDENQASRLKENDPNSSSAEINKLIDTIVANGADCYDSQAAAVRAISDCTQKALEWCEQHNRLQLHGLLMPLKTQLDQVNSDITDLEEKILIAKSMTKDSSDTADILPNQPTDGYTQILIQSTMSSASQKSGKSAESSQSSWGVSFFLGGYSSNKSHQQAVENTMSENSDMKIEIGMNIAKVQIQREWFEPGVFLLTDNMFNFSGDKVAPDNSTSFSQGTYESISERFAQMNQCILPAYPVAFVVAKDVSIRFTSEKAMSSTFAESVEDHASRGGGFFIFSGNSSSASSSSQSSAVASSSANSITIRFSAPQILGYYMQATPADRSDHIHSNQATDISIISFISDFRQMLADYNKERIR